MRLVILLIVSLMALVLARPQPAYAGHALNPLSATTGPVGTVLTVGGTAFAATTLITVKYDTVTVATVTSSSTGAWTTTFGVPVSSFGPHTVEATDGTNTPLTASFTVTGNASLSKLTGAPGSLVTVTGTGLNASQTGIAITFNSVQIATASANSAGSFSATFTVPSIAAGSYSVITAAPGVTITQTFTVTAGLALIPTSGPNGTTVTATGGGFGATTSLTLTLDGATLKAVTTDAQGAFSTSFQVTQTTVGAHTVNVAGSSITGPTFTVTPLLTLDRLSAAPGSTVTVSGTGFAASEFNIRITLDGASVTSGISANPQGTWTGSFSVPQSASGAHTVGASGSLTALTSVPEATFSVAGTITLDRTTGPPGAQVQVNGFGFAANALGITVTPSNGLAVGTSANAQGVWTATIVIPNAPSGPLTVRARAPGAVTADATFTITPIISLASSTGSPGQSVSVEGRGFPTAQSDIRVTLGVATATTQSDTNGSWSATLTIPAVAGGSYVVRTGGAAPSVEAPFTITPAVSLSPNWGTPGMQVTVTGAGFLTNQKNVLIIFGQSTATFMANANVEGSWTGTLTLPIVPAGGYSIRAGGTTPAEATFTITPDIAVSASRGSPGTQLTVTGAGFSANQKDILITLGQTAVGVAVTAASNGTWSATLAVPSSPSGSYKVKTGGLGPVLETTFTVTPAVSTATGQGVPGGQLTVTGTGFAANERNISVTFGQTTVATGIAADAQGSWATTIATPSLPASAYGIAAFGATSTVANVRGETFVIASGLSLSSSSATPGASIRIAGSGFRSAEEGIRVTFDGVEVVSGLIADTAGSFSSLFTVPTVPGGAHVIKVSGLVSGSVGASDLTFRIVPALSLGRPSGHPGTPVTVTGTGYAANETGIAISFDGITVLQGVRADAQGSFVASFSPPLATSGSHLVQSSPSQLGAARPEQAFVVSPTIILSSATGYVGAVVDVIGRGFAPASPIALSYENGQVASGTSDASGSFLLKLTIPKSVHGEHTISGQDALGNSATTPFTMDTTPPLAVSLIGPGDGSSGAILSGFRPTFRWSPSDDPSGVTYVLEVAHGRDFSTLALTKKGVTGTSYAVTDQEKLGRGIYYWRVKTIDAASNEGLWSDVSTVTSGVVPVWLFPLPFIILGVAAAAVVLFVRSRRRVLQPVFIPSPTRDAAFLTVPGLPAPRRVMLSIPEKLALPAPSRRGRGLSLEDKAQMQRVLDFVSALPMQRLDHDLAWLEELIGAGAGASDDIYEHALSGIEARDYRPVWTRNPAYDELQRLLQGQSFLLGLTEYVNAIDWCGSDAVAFLREIDVDLVESVPASTSRAQQWRLAISVAQDALGWFNGTFLAKPSPQDYVLPVAGSTGALQGAGSTPFRGTIVEGVNESDAVAYRDLLIRLRAKYRTNERAKDLEQRLRQANLVRDQLAEAIANFGDGR